MNKILTKVTALCVGLAMVAGVGVAVGSKKAGEAKADYSLEYTLDGTITATGNAYATASTVTQNSIGWKVVGNTEQNPWRIGGKGLTGVDRAVYSTTAIAANIAKIEVSSGATASSLTVNSLTITVHSSASDAESGSNAVATKTVTSGIASSTVTFEKSDSTSWAGKFYRIVYNVTRTSTSGNGYVTFKSAKFYSDTSESGDPAISLNPASLSFLSTDSAKAVTVSPNEEFSATPTISVSGTPSYVNCSVNGLTISVSPKAVGTETITVNAVNNTEQASATFSVEVIDAHGRTEDDPFSVAEIRSLIDQDQSKTHEGVYVEGIVSQVDEYKETYHSITYWISDDGSTTNQFECYSGKGIDSADFSSINDVEVGGVVVVCGNAKYYSSKSIYEFDVNNYQISYTAPVSTDYTVSFNGNGATGSMSSVSTHGSYNLPANGFNIPSGQMFVGWKADNAGDIIAVNDSYMVSQNVEFYAQWANVCVVSFDAGEGSGTMSSINVAEGSDYTLPACTFTAPEDKVFDHWELNGVEITIIESIDEDVEVVAIYTDAPSEVEATMTAGTNGSAAVVIADEVENAAIKVGTSSKGGDMTLTVGAGAKYVKFYAAAWKGATGLSLNITGAETDPSSVALNPDDGITSNSPYTLSGNAGDFLFTVNLTGITEETVLTLTTSTTKRFVLWGAVYGTNGSPEPEKVLTGISVSGAKTDFTVGNAFETTGLVVTAHYEDSPDATISSGYEVDSSSVDNTKAGEYTVTVSYGGFEDSYTVTYSNAVLGTYKKVKTNLANFAGDYLIVYEEGSVAFDGSLENPDVASNTFAVSIADETISASEAYEFTVSKKEGGYSLKSASGLYIGKTADSNGMDKNASDNYTNTISYSGAEESDMDIVGSGKPHLRYNASSGQERFRFYKSDSYTGQKVVSLYIEVANDAEAFALDILNLTTEVCSAEGKHAAGDFATAWSTLTTKYDSVVNKDLLVGGDADANGTFFAEALARYDILVAKYGLNPFMTGRVSNFSYLPHYESNLDSSSSITIIVIVAVASMTLLGVTLVIRKRKMN